MPKFHLRKAADLAQRYGARAGLPPAPPRNWRLSSSGKVSQQEKHCALSNPRWRSSALTSIAATSSRPCRSPPAPTSSSIDFDQAETLARKVLAEAETTRDESQVSEALGTLAIQAALRGALPESLQLRQRAEAIHRRQGDVALLPFDLTNRAELLIQLGRPTDAAGALEEVEEGTRKKLDAYLAPPAAHDVLASAFRHGRTPLRRRSAPRQRDRSRHE